MLTTHATNIPVGFATLIEVNAKHGTPEHDCTDDIGAAVVEDWYGLVQGQKVCVVDPQ